MERMGTGVEPAVSSGAPETVKERAANVREDAAEQAGEMATNVKDQAGAVAQVALDQGKQVVDRAREQLHEQGQQRANEAGQALHRVSDQLQALADGRPEEAGPVADYVRQASDRSRQVAARLEQGGVDGVVTDVTRFARRRPVLFLAMAGAAGFVVGRAVRSGVISESSHPSHGNGSSTEPTPSMPPTQLGAGAPSAGAQPIEGQAGGASQIGREPATQTGAFDRSGGDTALPS